MSRAPARWRVAPCLVAGLLVVPAPLWALPPEVRVPRPPRTVEKDCMPERWLEELWPPAAQVVFRPTTPEERAAFTRLIPALLEAAPRQRLPPPELVALAASVGFRLESWTGAHETLWALREQPGKHRGAGAYLFRTGLATEDILQAPHAYFDLGTGRLGLGLFTCAPAGYRPRAFATNTAHRYRGRPGEKPEDAEHPADVAHNPEHLFQQVMALMARTLSAPRVVQLHGFGHLERPGRASLQVVVSAGSHTPSRWARQVTRRLEVLLGEGVRLFPEQTRELGGTRNAQKQVLQAHPRSRFLHLELSAQARRALRPPEKLARLGEALFAPEED